MPTSLIPTDVLEKNRKRDIEIEENHADKQSLCMTASERGKSWLNNTGKVDRYDSTLHERSIQ